MYGSFIMLYSDIIKNTSHISEKDIIKKVNCSDAFVPFREALNNSLEAIKLKNIGIKNEYKGAEITISVYAKKDTANEIRLDYIEINDNGRGFTPEDIERFSKYFDDSKGFNNKGTGRFYLIKMFSRAVYDSICSRDKEFYNIKFEFSSMNEPENMFIKVLSENKIKKAKTGTTLKLYPWDEDYRKYNFFLNIDLFRQEIIDNFLLEFLLHAKTSIPTITINKYFGNQLAESTMIDKYSIPSIDQEETINIYFHKINYDSKTLDRTENKIKLKLYSAKSPNITKNKIVLTSSNQKVEDVKFQDLLPNEKIDNDKIILFVKSDYLDKPENIDDNRKKFNFYKRTEIEKILKKDEVQSDLNFSVDEYILRDDLEKQINKKFSKMYPDIKKVKTEKELELQKLKKRFLISDEIFNKVTKKLSLDASSEELFTEFYKAEAEVLAKKDILISNIIDEVSQIDTSDKNCMEKMDKLSEEIVKLIPLQNRNNLAQYVARRKIVLKAFNNILDNTDGEIKEKHLHNLFLIQGNNNNYEDSNLWMLNEDFIYFSGKSEGRICDYELEGKKVFNSKFSEEEEQYLMSLGENRKIKKPDILLFPEEGKCIIIEFKKPDVNVSDYITQVNKYASLIRNFATENFEFIEFYGYLIGEAIEERDVRGADGDFRTMYNGSGLYRPKKIIPCFKDSTKDGELYTEILSYRELLRKASFRNKVFVNKLGIENVEFDDTDC